MTRYETSSEGSEEAMREQLHHENEKNTFILRRNFHTTSKKRNSYQRETYFKPSVGLEVKSVT